MSLKKVGSTLGLLALGFGLGWLAHSSHRLIHEHGNVFLDSITGYSCTAMGRPSENLMWQYVGVAKSGDDVLIGHHQPDQYYEQKYWQDYRDSWAGSCAALLGKRYDGK